MSAQPSSALAAWPSAAKGERGSASSCSDGRGATAYSQTESVLTGLAAPARDVVSVWRLVASRKVVGPVQHGVVRCEAHVVVPSAGAVNIWVVERQPDRRDGQGNRKCR
jgi:hypothetical protein